MEKIKILEVLDSYFPCIDGAINAVHNYAKNLNELERCDLAVPSASKKLKYEDKQSYNVIRCKSISAPENYRLACPNSDRAFRKKIVSENYDIIHAQSPFSLGRFAVKTARKKGIPVVVTLHTKYYDDFLRSTKSKLLAKIALSYTMWVFRKADYVWTVSKGAAEVLKKYGYKGKIDVVKNGTDFMYPEHTHKYIELVDDKHNLKGQKNVFLFIGRMAMYKNLKLLCDGLKKLKENGTDFKMIFVGGGFDYDKIVNYTKKIGVNDNCIFTGEVRDREIVRAYLLRCDALLFPSTFDTSGLVGVEAATHKKPTVFIKGSNAADGVVDNRNGFLCEENSQSFGNKLIEITDKGQEYIKEVGQTAYLELSRSWKDVAKEVRQKYREIIEDYKVRQAEKKPTKKLLRKKQKIKATC